MAAEFDGIVAFIALRSCNLWPKSDFLVLSGYEKLRVEKRGYGEWNTLEN